MGLELTSEQLDLKQELKRWYKGFYKPYYYYSGPAGTGKTTVIQAAIEDLGISTKNFISTAFVGKAVLVLLRHGLHACTLHSLMYTPTYSAEDVSYVDEHGDVVTRKVKKMRFIKKESLDPNIKLIICDEARMVNDQMISDLLSFGIPVVFLGDRNQLPPVFGSSKLLKEPDFMLTKIMRQSEDDPIVYMSQCVLRGIELDYGTYGSSSIIRQMPVSKELITDYDIVLCGKNKTREKINTAVREEVYGYYTMEPRIGEKMICRQNNWDESLDGIYLTNGLVGYVEDVDLSSLYRSMVYIDFRPDFMDDKRFEKIAIDYKYLRLPQSQKANYGYSDSEKFEYAYALSTHLSQGSEYPNVLFVDEYFNDPAFMKALRYTAITRARDSVSWVKLPSKKYYNISRF